MKKTNTPSISLFDFGNSDFFLGRSSGREPFFVVENGQRFQNMRCQVSGKDFQELYSRYIKEENKNAKKSKK